MAGFLLPTPSLFSALLLCVERLGEGGRRRPAGAAARVTRRDRLPKPTPSLLNCPWLQRSLRSCAKNRALGVVALGTLPPRRRRVTRAPSGSLHFALRPPAKDTHFSFCKRARLLAFAFISHTTTRDKQRAFARAISLPFATARGSLHLRPPTRSQYEPNHQLFEHRLRSV